MWFLAHLNIVALYIIRYKMHTYSTPCLEKCFRGVYSSRKSELFPSAKHCLSNPSPNSSHTSKLQVPPNQGHIHLGHFLWWFGAGVTVTNACLDTQGGLRGMCGGYVPPSEAGKFRVGDPLFNIFLHFQLFFCLNLFGYSAVLQKFK